MVDGFFKSQTIVLHGKRNVDKRTGIRGDKKVPPPGGAEQRAER